MHHTEKTLRKAAKRVSTAEPEDFVDATMKYQEAYTTWFNSRPRDLKMRPVSEILVIVDEIEDVL